MIIAQNFIFYHNNISNLGAAHRYFYLFIICTYQRGAAPTLEIATSSEKIKNKFL